MKIEILATREEIESGDADQAMYSIETCLSDNATIEIIEDSHIE